MITTAQEYYSLLYRIQDPNLFLRAYGGDGTPPMQMPADEPTLLIDLNTRTIQAPEFLGVRHDHNAETLFFEVDRYFDSVDLATMFCVVQYENKTTKKSRIYPVPYYDITTKEDKLIFPWDISGEATRYPGIVEYTVKFYQIEIEQETENDISYKFAYNLNMQPARSKVLDGMSNDVMEAEDYSDKIDDILALQVQIEALKKLYDIYWLEV